MLQLYVNGLVPPFTVKSTVPVGVLQPDAVDVLLKVGALPDAIVADDVVVQPLASVTVTVYVP